MAISHKLKLYKQVGIEARVLGASPHQLISLLFESADFALQSAAKAMGRQNWAVKGEHISRVVSILSLLRESLDERVAGGLPGQLDSLYRYLQRRVLQAHLNNDPLLLDEAQQLLATLSGAWREIAIKGDV